MSSAFQQRVVGHELPRVFLEHHRHAVAQGKRQPLRAAYQHLRAALELERPLAHGASQDVEQSFIHVLNYFPGVFALNWLARMSTRSINSRVAVSENSAVTGTYQQRSSANAAHFTASFSVMSTGRLSPKLRSACLNAW